MLPPGIKSEISLKVVRTRLFQEQLPLAYLDINTSISHLCLCPVPVRNLGRDSRSICLHFKSAERKPPYAMGICPQSVLLLPEAAQREYVVQTVQQNSCFKGY